MLVCESANVTRREILAHKEMMMHTAAALAVVPW